MRCRQLHSRIKVKTPSQVRCTQEYDWELHFISQNHAPCKRFVVQRHGSQAEEHTTHESIPNTFSTDLCHSLPIAIDIVRIDIDTYIFTYIFTHWYNLHIDIMLCNKQIRYVIHKYTYSMSNYHIYICMYICRFMYIYLPLGKVELATSLSKGHESPLSFAW